ncbi:MAG: 4-hydroxy-tetrahydrodipicolinate reductase [Bacteroidia bacterium]|nr:MAG: 4-hydroxy-tetrahydrodipicolinate reductase [Bacteroidia bacterium]
MRVALIGTGRMGPILKQVLEERGHQVVAHVGRPSESFWAGLQAQAVVDFSHAAQTQAIVRASLERNLVLVTGTTGWQAQEESLRTWAKQLPHARWTWSSNFSRGILLFQLVLQTLQKQPHLLEGWDTALVEIHHHRKKDAPSGTALRLNATLPALRGITSLRVGEVVGEHRYLFSTLGEELEILHRAYDRAVFARGAVWALERLASLGSSFVGPWESLLITETAP